MFNPVNKILFYLLIKKHILSSLNNDIGGSNLDQITVNYFSIGNAFKFQLMLPTILRRWISSRGCIHRELGSQKTIRNSAPFLWGGSLQVRFRSFSLYPSLSSSLSLSLKPSWRPKRQSETPPPSYKEVLYRSAFGLSLSLSPSSLILFLSHFLSPPPFSLNLNVFMYKLALDLFSLYLFI